MPESEEALLRRAAWVARKSPWWLGEKSPVSDDLAVPLAAWLDDAAHWCSGDGQFIHPRSPTGRAVAVARALLGEPVPAPEGDDHQEGQP